MNIEVNWWFLSYLVIGNLRDVLRKFDQPSSPLQPCFEIDFVPYDVPTQAKGVCGSPNVLNCSKYPSPMGWRKEITSYLTEFALLSCWRDKLSGCGCEDDLQILNVLHSYGGEWCKSNNNSEQEQIKAIALVIYGYVSVPPDDACSTEMCGHKWAERKEIKVQRCSCRSYPILNENGL